MRATSVSVNWRLAELTWDGDYEISQVGPSLRFKINSMAIGKDGGKNAKVQYRLSYKSYTGQTVYSSWFNITSVPYTYVSGQPKIDTTDPVEFTITASYGGRTIASKKMFAYQPSAIYWPLDGDKHNIYFDKVYKQSGEEDTEHMVVSWDKAYGYHLDAKP